MDHDPVVARQCTGDVTAGRVGPVMVITRVPEFALAGPAVTWPPITVDLAVAAGPALACLGRLCQPEQQESCQQGQNQPEWNVPVSIVNVCHHGSCLRIGKVVMQKSGIPYRTL
jgi:hypothetical protein